MSWSNLQFFEIPLFFDSPCRYLVAFVPLNFGNSEKTKAEDLHAAVRRPGPGIGDYQINALFNYVEAQPEIEDNCISCCRIIPNLLQDHCPVCILININRGNFQL